MSATPGFWRHESSGVFTGPIRKYLGGQSLTPEDVQLIRAYLKQWIAAPVWGTDAEVAALRHAVNELYTSKDIHRWIHRALDVGIDPL